MNPGPSDPTAIGCGTLINLGHTASPGGRRNPRSHGTRHRRSSAGSPAGSRTGSGGGGGTQRRRELVDRLHR
jgi:hypothetical protein